MDEKDVLFSDFVLDAVWDALYKWDEYSYLWDLDKEMINRKFKKIYAAIEFVNESRGMKGKYTTLNELYDEIYNKVMSNRNSKI